MIRLEQLRLDARLSPEGLAVKAGVDGETIRRIETGKGARASTLGKLADCFEGVSPSELLQPAVFRGPTDWPASDAGEGKAA